MESYWLWPVSWVVTGFVLTSIFVLGHDCGHYSMFRRRWLSTLVALFLQIWMVSYTYLRHTAADAKFFTPAEWTPFRGRAIGTLNVLFPRWISFLHLNIDVHIPHHLSPKIPCYYLREGNAALRDSPYGPTMNERKFSLIYYYRQWRDCNLWDVKNHRFASFADARRFRNEYTNETSVKSGVARTV